MSRWLVSDNRIVGMHICDSGVAEISALREVTSAMAMTTVWLSRADVALHAEVISRAGVSDTN